jgi:hypothetical protein
VLQLEAFGGSPRQEVLDGLATVKGRSIPNEKEFAAHLAQEQTQETDHLGAVIGPRWGLQDEAPVAAQGADGRAMAARWPRDGRAMAARWPRADRG